MKDIEEQKLVAELELMKTKKRPRVLFWLIVCAGSLSIGILLTAFSIPLKFNATGINQFVYAVLCISWIVMWINIFRRIVIRIGIRKIMKSLNYLHQSGLLNNSKK